MSDFEDESKDLDLAPPAEGEQPRRQRRGGATPHESEQLLRRVLDIVNGARPLPMSSSVRIDQGEVAELLEEAIARLPDELRAARWLLKEREEFLAKVRREGEDILEQARSRAERMVQRTEVVKAADARARQIVERAEDNARRMRLECEDFCDQKLASFEIVLERTQKLVAAGRAKLAANPLTGEQPAIDAAGEPETRDRPRGRQVFDQDI